MRRCESSSFMLKLFFHYLCISHFIFIICTLDMSSKPLRVDVLSGASRLDEPIAAVRKAIADLGSILLNAAKASNDSVHVDACARQIAFGIARIWAGALLIRHASDQDATKGDVNVAYRWCCEQPLVDLKMDWLSGDRVQLDRDIVFQNFSEGSRNSKL
ncbi:hypothetical protein ANCDUO_13704 [Ancylostoma duodenale]|uniref:Acyl-CoA dehydrogenase 11-like C-terminal domain-containing protein n=1 Tax=Ancylostoma duodenale TaxID=51022 RepID=A0A0C2CI98_9BILA|nr:hypothetical protein ANCDUO_13704 [Ancylostoma duodenale]